MSNNNLYTRQSSLNLSIPNRVILYVPTDVLFTGDFTLSQDTKTTITELYSETNSLELKLLLEELEGTFDLYLKEYCREAFDNYMLYLEKLIIKFRTVGVNEVVLAFPNTNEYLGSIDLQFTPYGISDKVEIPSYIKRNLDVFKGSFNIRGLTLKDISNYTSFGKENFLVSANFSEVPSVLKRLTHPFTRFSSYSKTGIMKNHDTNIINVLMNYIDSNHRLDFKRSVSSITDIELTDTDTLITMHDDTLFKTFSIDNIKLYTDLLGENVESGFVNNTEFKTSVYIPDNISEYKLKTFKAVRTPKTYKDEPLWDSMSYPFLTNFDIASGSHLMNAIFQSEFEFSRFLAEKNDYFHNVSYNHKLLHQFTYFNCNETTLLCNVENNTSFNESVPLKLENLRGKYIIFTSKNYVVPHINLELLKSVSEDILVDFVCRPDMFVAGQLYSARGFMDNVVVKSINTLDIKPTRSRKPAFL